ncbi:DoxX family protein [Marinobacter confluentis]|uniref:DoxX family protein n=1 Tax=Marinobacter confluentis TaxID=1697557 RepID=A0A4Z1BHV0_9GAMM|nr:DoxX family protein [Marinobacter confluentis]TGN39129.1 DoxX family protein [Marinobacter confluentis]
MNTNIANTLLSSSAGVAALILRVPVGLILAAHGAQKLFGWFGGYGLDGTGQWMASIGLEPGYLMALLAGGAEFFGGLALALGLMTRPAAFVNAIAMLVAIFAVHIGNGLFMANNGYEYALTLFVINVAFVIQGGGRFALDNALLRYLSGGAAGQRVVA